MFDGFKVTRVFGDDWDRLNDMKNVFMRWRMVVNHLLYICTPYKEWGCMKAN